MKITCQSCQAKYTIADDKVLGKIVKIRCKKCSATIVVNGNDPSGVAPQAAPAPEMHAPEMATQDEWSVNVAEGDQRTMSSADVVSAYQSGVVVAETYCWRDGMTDWLPLKEIDSLYEACNATRAFSESLGEEAARLRGKGAPSSGRAVGEPREYAAAGNGTSNGGAAARRAGGRAAGADLFHGAAQAGGEEDVLTSAPAGAHEGYDAGQKPTIGARNETSVLFSLSALTSKGSERPPPVPGVEASGLIDIRQLSAQMGKIDEKKKSRVDDIMNLSSGGAFNASLSAPVLAPPSIDQYGPAAGAAAGGPRLSGAPGKSKALIFLALGAGAFVIVAAVGATTLLMHKDTDTAAAGSASAAGAESVPAQTASAPAAETATAAPAQAAASANAAANAPTANATAVAAPTAAPVAATPQAAGPAAQSPHPEAAHPAPHPAGPAAAAPEADQPFNMGEAKSRLAAAAAAAQGCKKPDGPVGTGRAVIVFGPSGAAQSATISGPPFEGTPTGACVGSRFRGVHVPAFSGSPFSVSKSFTIN
jgi:predicted Zn finger-like uncharacterized protein